MPIIERHTSKRGVPVTLERGFCPDSGRVPYITLRYGRGKTPGRVAYYLDNEHCAGYVELVRDRFIEDRDTLGQPIDSKRLSRMRVDAKNTVQEGTQRTYPGVETFLPSIEA